MKRDMDLFRRILLQLEASPEATGHSRIDLDIEDRDPTEVSYHVQLLKEAGLIEAVNEFHLTGFR